MEELAALAEQHDELDALLAGLDGAGWARPSRCPGWSVADVALHLAQTDEMACASVDGWLAEHLDGAGRAWGAPGDVDEGAAAMVAAERDRAPSEVYDRWQAGASRLRTLLADADPSRRVPWVAGELSVRTLAATRLAECWIHTGDIAAAFGPLPPPTDRLRIIARLAWRTLPYAFARAARAAPGPVAFHLTGPSGDEWHFDPDLPPTTVVRGPAIDLCLVAGQRADAADTALDAAGPDGPAVLELVRTFA